MKETTKYLIGGIAVGVAATYGASIILKPKKNEETSSFLGFGNKTAKSKAWEHDAQGIVRTTFSAISFAKSQGNNAYSLPINSLVEKMKAPGGMPSFGYSMKMSTQDAQAVVRMIFNAINYDKTHSNYAIPVGTFVQKMKAPVGMPSFGYGAEMPTQQASAIVTAVFKMIGYANAHSGQVYGIPVNQFTQEIINLYNPSIYPYRPRVRNLRGNRTQRSVSRLM